MRFPQKSSHVIWLEPEGYDSGTRIPADRETGELNDAVIRSYISERTVVQPTRGSARGDVPIRPWIGEHQARPTRVRRRVRPYRRSGARP